MREIRTEKDIEACDHKRLYDTEWEAELSAAKYEAHSGDEMKAYRCPGTQHFHITHKNKERQGFARTGERKCLKCNQFIKNKKYHNHIKSCEGIDEEKLDVTTKEEL